MIVATHDLEVRADGDELRLVLNAPHGEQPVSSSEEVKRFIARFPPGKQLRCVCDLPPGAVNSIRNYCVVRIAGPYSALAPAVLALPAEWAIAEKSLARARAVAHLDASDETAALPFLARALEEGAQNAHVAYGRLSAGGRAKLLAAFAEWSKSQPTEWDVLRHLPLERWSRQHLEAAAEVSLKRGCVFGDDGPTTEVLLAQLRGRGSKSAKLASLTEKLRAAKETMETAAPDGASFRLETPLNDAEVIGSAGGLVHICGFAKRATARASFDAVRPLAEQMHRAHVARGGASVVAYSAMGEVVRYEGLVATRVRDGLAFFERPADPAYAFRLPSRERLFELAAGVRGIGRDLAWGFAENSYVPPRQVVELRDLQTGEVDTRLEADGVTLRIQELLWDETRIYLTSSEGAALRAFERRTAKPLWAVDDVNFTSMSSIDGGWIACKSGAHVPILVSCERGDRKPDPRRGGGDDDDDLGDVRIRIVGETLEIPSHQSPFRASSNDLVWTRLEEGGYEAMWNDRDRLYVRRASSAEPYHAFLLTDEPKSVVLAPPWIALAAEPGVFWAIALSDVETLDTIAVRGAVVAKRAAQRALVAATPHPKTIAMWTALVDAGVLVARPPAERDATLLATVATAAPTATTLGRLLRSLACAAVVSHDAHWFEAVDGIIEQFDEALVGEPVRFSTSALEGERLTLEIRPRTGAARTVTAEPLIWQVAEIIDAALAEGSAGRRVYALTSTQEDVFVYAVLSPDAVARLHAAGVRGIAKKPLTRAPRKRAR